MLRSAVAPLHAVNASQTAAAPIAHTFTGAALAPALVMSSGVGLQPLLDNPAGNQLGVRAIRACADLRAQSRYSGGTHVLR